MFYKDLQDMLNGMKTKLYHKTFKKVTEWDVNFMKFVQSSVQSCLNKIDEILLEPSLNFDSKSAFEGYVNIRNMLTLTMNDVNFHINFQFKVYLTNVLSGERI